MAGRIDQERAVLNDHYPSHSTNEECTERADPSVPNRAKDGRQDETDEYGEEMDVPMLPHDKRILFQIGHIIKRRVREELEQEPADVGVKKSFRDVVWVLLTVNVFVMTAMFRRPKQY